MGIFQFKFNIKIDELAVSLAEEYISFYSSEEKDLLKKGSELEKEIS